MKRVRMLISMAGPDESWVPGDEREVADYVAEVWVKTGHAELVAEQPAQPEPPKETAALETPQPEGKPAPRRRQGKTEVR